MTTEEQDHIRLHRQERERREQARRRRNAQRQDQEAAETAMEQRQQQIRQQRAVEEQQRRRDDRDSVSGAGGVATLAHVSPTVAVIGGLAATAGQPTSEPQKGIEQ